MLYTCIGLGNPGDEHRATRHNTGRIILEYLQKMNDFPEWSFDAKIHARVSTEKMSGKKIVFVLPETYMNKSGETIKKLHIADSKLKIESMIVVHDDLDLPLGTFKIVFNRGSGGHRGVESVIRALKTKGFARIRVGISPTTPSGKLKKPKGEKAVERFILGEFKENERKALQVVSKKVGRAIAVLITDGKERAMNEFN